MGRENQIEVEKHFYGFAIFCPGLKLSTYSFTYLLLNAYSVNTEINDRVPILKERQP